MADQAEQPAVSDLPTGEPMPAVPPSKAAAPVPSKAHKIPLSTILAAAPGNLDAFLAHLHRCMSTPSGIDIVIMFVGYTARLSSNLLDTASRTALHNSAHRLISLAFSLPPNTTFLLSSAPRASPVAAFAIKLAARLRALSDLLSEGRTFMRTWALLGIYFWGRGLAQSLVEAARRKKQKPSSEKQKQPEDTAGADHGHGLSSGEVLDKSIAVTQFLSIAGFQVLENAVFLSSKGVLDLTPAQKGKALLWSTRGFMAYVGVELGRLVIDRHRHATGQDGVDVQSAEHLAWKEAWQRSFARYLAWAPLTVNWSFGSGFLHDNLIWAIACVPATVQMRHIWKENA